MPLQPTIHSTPAIRHRFHLLDALRGIAAVLVAAGHDKYLVHRFGLHNDYLAVDFFFCLSGFVIASSYETRLITGMRARDFIAARLIRLYPVYLLAITVALIYELTFAHSLGKLTFSGFLMAALLVPNVRILPSVFLFPLDVPSWSLFFEVLANIAYAFLIKFRRAGVGSLLLITLVSFVALVCGISRGDTLLDSGVTNFHFQALLGIFRVFLSFALGVLTLRLFRKGAHFHFFGRSLSWVPFGISLTLILLLLSPSAVMQTNTFRLLSILVLFPALTYLGADANPPAAFTPACAALGELSYPLYLIHIVFLEFAGSRVFLKYKSIQHDGITLFLILLAIAAAYLIAKFYDAPVRRRLTTLYRNATAQVAQS